MSLRRRRRLGSRFGQIHERLLDPAVQLVEPLDQLVVPGVEPVQQFLGLGQIRRHTWCGGEYRGGR